MWIKIILVAEIFFTVGEVRSDIDILSSGACHTSSGICSHHSIQRCDKHALKIAIIDAYYVDGECEGNKTMCSADFSIPEKRNGNTFGTSHLKEVDRICTLNSECTFQAQYSGSQAFSVIKYKCISDQNEINMCNGERKEGRDISLLFGRNLKSNCICYISTGTGGTSGVIDFHLLAMNLSTRPCTNLSISTGDEVRSYDCTTPVTPYRYLANSTMTDGFSKVTIENPGRVWMQITGTKKFKITCSSEGTTTTLPGNSSPFGTGSVADDGADPGAVAGADAGAYAGAVAGGVTVAVLVIVAVVLVLLWFRYKRNQKSKPTLSEGTNPGENNSMESGKRHDYYHEIEVMKPKKSVSDYDYATVAGEVNNAGKEGQSQKDIDHIYEKQTKETDDTDLLTAKPYINKSFTENEDDYNHLASNEESKAIENGINTGGYDTAASAFKSVQQIRNKGIPKVDSECEYNHIDNNPKPKPLQGDYDTTASASKAVAKMMETNEQTEDDYDHFRQTKAGSRAVDSPYDTAEHHAEHSGDYSVAGVLQKDDPYELAK